MSSIAQDHITHGSLTAAEAALMEGLLSIEQGHLFEGWSPPGGDLEAKRAMLAQLARVDASYPGGLAAYVTRARTLLAASREGANPFEGLTPERPEAVDLSELDARYEAMEQRGLEAAAGLGVVLVAGGLGERLGYPGIKVDIPVEVTEGRSYLETYADWLVALGRRVGRRLPLVIMTSGQTHEATLASLESLWRQADERPDGAGLDRAQVTVLRQELVPALADDAARVALDGPYAVQLKPHGHGDVHLLMHTSGAAARLGEAGCTHLLFIQDTNAQVINGALAALGVSVDSSLAFNTVAVPRMGGEAVGAISRLVGADGALTINVEYNQLDALLRATVDPAGDAGDEAGRSPFPGNTNTLVVAMSAYLPTLAASEGIIAEFVNPKYADATRTTFKKPTRLETMMQDLPRLFGAEQRVGVTVMDRAWSFSADKNAVSDARAKAAAGRPPECAASAEAELYQANRRKLSRAGVQVAADGQATWRGVPVADGARVVLSPRFALTLGDVAARVSGGSLDAASTLVLDGAGITLRDVHLRGSAGLWVRAVDGASLRVEGITLDEAGFHPVALTEEELADPAVPDFLKIRGYRVVAEAPLVVELEEPGEYVLDAEGLRRLG